MNFDIFIFIDLDNFTHDEKARIHTHAMNNNEPSTSTNSNGSYVSSSYQISEVNNHTQPSSIPVYAKIAGRGRKLCNEQYNN